MKGPGACAIDPGLSGALAFFLPPMGLTKVLDMPTTARVHGKGQKVDAHALAQMLYDEPVSTVYVERVGPMPGQGVTSMFHFGESVGLLEGICVANGLRLVWVQPLKWKKHFSLTGKSKEAALTLARERWPNLAPTTFSRKKDVGRADAALLGLYALDN